MNYPNPQQLFFCVFFLCSFSLFGNEPVDRDTFIKTFIEKADLVHSFDERIVSAEADVFRAKGQYFPRIKLSFGMAPSPGYTYIPPDPQSTEEEKYRGYWKKDYYIGDWGIALQAKGEIVIPIYTFGKIGNAQDAAEKGVEVRKAERDISILELRKEASSFYYAYVMATDMENIMDFSLEKISDAETKLDQWMYEGKEGVSQNDLIKLHIEKERLFYSKDRIVATKETLHALFEKILGSGYILKDQFMYQTNFSPSLEMLTAQLVDRSAYSRLLSNGLSALESLYKLEISEFFPDLGAMGDYRIDYTSNVHDRNYPLPSSPYNGQGGEVGIGMVFDLNILEQVAKMRKAKAEWKALTYKVSFAKETALLDLVRKFNELKALNSQIEHVRIAHKLSKGWMTTELMNYKNGDLSVRDLVDSVKSFIENEYQLISSMYDYNMKVEEINALTGNDS